MSSLDSLREQVAGIDREILRLVARRNETVRRIGELKRELRVPLRNFEVERRVLERADAIASELGLPSALARGLSQMLIAASCEEQEMLTYATYTGPTERILIVGGAGKMGRWLTDFLQNQGHDVVIEDPAADSSCGPARSRSADLPDNPAVAFVASPLEHVPRAIDELAARRFGGVICDIASLKTHVAPAIQRARSAGLRVTSIHPMFGPSARTLSDKIICLCDCGDAAATGVVRGLFAETAASLVELTLEEHDRLVAYVLGLSHLVNIIFAAALQSSGHKHADFLQVASTTFRNQMATTAAVAHENPELYYSIQRLNAFTPAVYAQIEQALRRVTQSILGEQKDEFVALMTAARLWMDEKP